jgi:hypothetical protein
MAAGAARREETLTGDTMPARAPDTSHGDVLAEPTEG